MVPWTGSSPRRARVGRRAEALIQHADTGPSQREARARTRRDRLRPGCAGPGGGPLRGASRAPRSRAAGRRLSSRREERARERQRLRARLRDRFGVAAPGCAAAGPGSWPRTRAKPPDLVDCAPSRRTRPQLDCPVVSRGGQAGRRYGPPRAGYRGLPLAARPSAPPPAHAVAPRRDRRLPGPGRSFRDPVSPPDRPLPATLCGRGRLSDGGAHAARRRRAGAGPGLAPRARPQLPAGAIPGAGCSLRRADRGGRAARPRRGDDPDRGAPGGGRGPARRRAGAAPAPRRAACAGRHRALLAESYLRRLRPRRLLPRLHPAPPGALLRGNPPPGRAPGTQSRRSGSASCSAERSTSTREAGSLSCCAPLSLVAAGGASGWKLSPRLALGVGTAALAIAAATLRTPAASPTIPGRPRPSTCGWRGRTKGRTAPS